MTKYYLIVKKLKNKLFDKTIIYNYIYTIEEQSNFIDING